MSAPSSDEFEALAVSIEEVRSSTKATPGCIANAIRRYACGLNWPPTFYANPAHKAVLRRMIDMMGLRTRERSELVTQGVAILELVTTEHPDLRLAWSAAFSGEPGGGGLYPPSAPDVAARGPEFRRRLRALQERWAAHHLRRTGKEATPAAVRALVDGGYATAIAMRVRAFAVKRPGGVQPADEGEPIFAEHRHWAVRATFRLADVDALAWKEQWHFNSVTPKHDQRPGEFTWTPVDEATTIRYCESAIVKARYLYASGRDAKAVSEKLGTLDVFTVEELVGLVRTTEDIEERARTLVKLGIAATPRGVLHREKLEPEADVAALLEAALRDGPPPMRDAAITAANFLKWDVLVPALESIPNYERALRAVREITRYVATLK